MILAQKSRESQELITSMYIKEPRSDETRSINVQANPSIPRTSIGAAEVRTNASQAGKRSAVISST